MKNIKSWAAVLLACLLALGLVACGQTEEPAPNGSEVAAGSSSEVVESTPVEGGGDREMRIAGLKGPTTMGMVKLMQEVQDGEAGHNYNVEMFGSPDEIVPKLVSGEIDAAAIPANLASVLYNNTDGAVQVAAINTLGVLYVLETGNGIQSVEDLRGRTVYSTGKGTTPEFVMNYILAQNGLEPGVDLTIEYKSEATEVAAMLAEADDAVAVLPQPYVTAVQMQNEAVRTALDLTAEWDAVGEVGALVTGVLVVRKEFAEQNSELFSNFLQDYKASVGWVNSNTADAARLVADFGIVEKAPVAEKALPACNITYVDGDEMREMLSGYLQVLYDQQAEAVGGQLPAEDFYYKG